MPFKALHTLRRVTDLEGEVRASAVLTTTGVVAMASTSPARLGLLPASGANGRTLELRLSQADEVAFITKDVVVVRSGDEVWALLGTSHTPKTEQVARDARALCMRPSGETALVLRWDGSAIALTMGNNEVDARPFALRGDVRAADVGATETVVVVDDGAGGELRIHTGATPEPGPRARVKLPGDAAKFDRVRGGTDLAAVFKKDATSLCVARREGAGFSAKMVHLGAKIADARVLETSLFIAFADGRLAIYDRDALAGEGTLEATHALPLGAKGQPTTMTLAAKGSPSLWVGTSAGEVFQAGVARKATRV